MNTIASPSEEEILTAANENPMKLRVVGTGGGQKMLLSGVECRVVKNNIKGGVSVFIKDRTPFRFIWDVVGNCWKKGAQ